MGTSLRRGDYTQAAERAVRDALWHNSINLAELFGFEKTDMQIRLDVGVQQPDKVDVDVLRAVGWPASDQLDSESWQTLKAWNEGGSLKVSGDNGLAELPLGVMTDLCFWNDGVLDFHVFGWGPVVVRRYLDGDQLVWEYADGSTTRMDRLCTLPEDQRVPAPRGPRFQLF